MADEPSFFAQIGQKRSQQCREDSHTAFLQSVLQRDLINNFKPGAFEWPADFTFNLLPYLHKGSCSLPLSKISEIQHFQFFHLLRVFYVILSLDGQKYEWLMLLLALIFIICQCNIIREGLHLSNNDPKPFVSTPPV